MEENVQDSNQQQDIVDPKRLIKKVHKSRKVRKGRKKQSVLRKTVRFLMTVFIIFLLIYVSKMPQWYLPKDAYTKISGNSIIIKNNMIVKPYRIYAVLRLHKVPNKPIYMMKTKDIEKDIKKLKQDYL